MSSTAAFLASFASILIGAAVGMVLRRALPADLLEGGSKEAIRLGAGFLSTLAALVIGLMIASAKNTYDNQNTNIRQLGTNAVLVDQMLTKYGPEAKAARTLLRETIPSATARIWRENVSGKGGGLTFVVSEHRRTVLQCGRRPQAGQCRTDLAEIPHHPAHHRHGPDAATRVHPGRGRDTATVLHRAGVLAGGDLRELQPVRRTRSDRRRLNTCFRALGIERAVFDRRSQPSLPRA